MTDLARLTSALAGHYAIEKELGAGGMATVYLAQDLKHHRQVMLHRSIASGAEANRLTVVLNWFAEVEAKLRRAR